MHPIKTIFHASYGAAGTFVATVSAQQEQIGWWLGIAVAVLSVVNLSIGLYNNLKKKRSE